MTTQNIARSLLVSLVLWSLAACTSNRAARNAECTFNGDCANALVCAAGYCRAQCSSDTDCTPGGTCILSSDPSKTVCHFPGDHALCTSAADCETGRHCSAQGLCSLGCADDGACAAFARGSVCAPSGECTLPAVDGGVSDSGVDASDAREAGCVAPMRTCNGACVDPMTDPLNCGACGTRCPAVVAPNAQPACVAGVCGSACVPGYHTCGGECVSNGSLTSCGTTCTPCGVIAGGTPTCDGIRCGVLCNFGFHMCGATCADQTSLQSCGSSCTPCPTPPHATATCDGTSCGVTCATGYIVDAMSCQLAAPSILAPTSTSTVTRRRPTVTVRHNTAIANGVQAQFCADRACTTVVSTAVGTGPQAAPASDLAPGLYFVRAASMVGSEASTIYSPAVEIVVGAANTPVDSFHGTFPDPNGDGLADVLVGSNTGFAVYDGTRAGPSTTASVSAVIPTDGTGVVTVRSAGDVNGDGFADVLAFRPGAANAWIYLGGSAGLDVANPTALTRSGTTINDAVGVGDVDGDGFGEIALSYASGQPQVFRGSASGTSQTSTATLNAFILSIVSVGDFNGDRKADIAMLDVGYTLQIYDSIGTGSVNYSTSLSLGSTTSALIEVGDVNGDGYCDIGNQSTMMTVIRSGSSSGNIGTTPIGTITADSTRGVGDVNGDGFADLLVGVPGNNNVSLYGGAATTVPTTALWTVTAPGTLGNVFAIAGDSDGDHFDDVLIGTDTGKVEWFAGAATMPSATPQVTITDAITVGFGRWVAMRSTGSRMHRTHPPRS